jgi:hypothetical protein
MLERDRLNNGTFAPKSSQIREVRSLRLTSKTWKLLGDTAESRGITRADLIEELATSGAIEQWISGSDYDEIEELRKRVSDLVAEKEELLERLSDSRDTLDFNDIHSLRDKVLDSLGMGQQSKPYKNASKVFSRFIQTYFST